MINGDDLDNDRVEFPGLVSALVRGILHAERNHQGKSNVLLFRQVVLLANQLVVFL